MISPLHIHLMGDFRLVSGDSPLITFNNLRFQSLLAYLLLHRDSPQDRSHLAFILWPDSSEAQAHTNLRKLLHQFRQAFPDADHFISADKRSLRWRPDPLAPWTLDTLEFEESLARAEQAAQAQAIPALRQALEQAIQRYRGNLLPACYDEWILPERERLRLSFLCAAQRLAELLEQEREYDAALAVAQRLLRHDPLQEVTYRQLMRLYALRGDRAAALRVYHSCATLLERELGVEPGSATREAYELLLHAQTVSRPSSGPSLRGSAAPLIGRTREWKRLQATWSSAAGGSPHMVILSGEAGIGKTRLAEELLTWAGRQGVTSAVARCYAAEGHLAYAPVSSWLRADALEAGLSTLDPLWLGEVARLLPELLVKQPHLPQPHPILEGWQRQRFFEAMARALLSAGAAVDHQGLRGSSRPLLLLLDDLQWCDRETLEWLHFLLRYAPGAQLLLAGTVRAEEILPTHPLLALLGTLQRAGLLTEIALGPLSTAETASLAEHVAGGPLDPTTLDDLHTETEGNPLFVVEMMRTGALRHRQGEFSSSVHTSHPLLSQPISTLPPTVQSVLSTRLGQLSPPARSLANLAAVIGREFSFTVLARASAEREEVLAQGLDELWQRRIVREQGTGASETYDFSHDKLREQAYASLSPAQRRRLHLRVSRAFAEVYAADLEAVSGQIAVHYERAGLLEQAIPHYRRAGEVAMGVYAHGEAIAALQRAIILLESDRGDRALRQRQWQEEALLHEHMGDIFKVEGRLQEARESYQCATTCIPAQECIWLARLQRKRAGTWQEAPAGAQGEPHANALRGYREAERLLEQASLRSGDEWRREWIELQLIQLLPLRAPVDAMSAIIEKAQPVVEQYGTAEQRVHFYLAIVARDISRDHYVAADETTAYCRHALAISKQADDRGLTGFAHFALGVCLLFSDHLAEAQEQVQTALRVGEQIGSATIIARCLTFLPVIFRRGGQVERVREIVARALATPDIRHMSVIAGQRAWLAWRAGDLDDAEAFGHSSLEETQGQLVIAFQWVGLWPLIGVMLSREELSSAMNYAGMLIAPAQQPPPTELNNLLQAALHAWEDGLAEEAEALLRQTVPLARELGFL